MCSFPVWPQKARNVWSNIFRIFYNLPPILDTDGHGSILENSQALVEKAEELQSTDIASCAIHTTLLSFDQELYRSIAQDPTSWVKLAVRIQSAPIFQESMIHLVGKWGFLEVKDRESLPKNIRTLCNRKIHDLDVIKKSVELQIVTHLPCPRSDSARYRETNNVFGWMALTFYQQWLCESFAESRNRHAPDGGAAFYRAIAAGVNPDIAQFPDPTDTNGESNKGLKELEKDLNELKKGMKGFISDLLVNQAKYDPLVLGELQYLTCCKVREEEMPLPQAIADGVNNQLPGVGDIMAGSRTNVPNYNNLQQTFVPAEPMMDSSPGSVMGLNNNLGNDFLLSPQLQNPNQSPFGTFNSFTQVTADPILTWENAMDFSSLPTNTAGVPIPPFSGMASTTANDIFPVHTQFGQDNNLGDNMDILDMPLMAEANEYMHNNEDGNMAFL
ncbi:hypothetical protein BJX76DRAFT_315315 [Aspergillus varians]